MSLTAITAGVSHTHAAPRRSTVRSALAWSDGGAEFLFDDGVALLFGPGLDTFVKLTPDRKSVV